MGSEDKADGITLDEALERIGFGAFHIRLTLIMALSLAAEAIEFFTLSYVTPYASCDWQLSNFAAAVLSTVFFIGLIIGNYGFGTLADCYGRQRTLVIAEAVMGYFAVLSAFAPSYEWFGFLRAVVGAAVAGVLAAAYPLYMELSPSTHRHILFLIHPIVGSLSTVILYAVGSEVIPRYGWRVLVALAATPSVISLILIITLIPRSPRHLMLLGEISTARRILISIGKTNKRPLIVSVRPPVVSVSPTKHCGLAHMFRLQQLRLTIPLLIIWFCAGLLHYSILLLGMVLPSVYLNRCSASIFPSQHLSSNIDSSCSCESANEVYLMPLIFGALGEALGLVFPGIIARFFGRRVALFLSGGMVAALCLSHALCKTVLSLSILLFFQRAGTVGLFLTCILYTTEAYPTSTRAVALGLGSALNRVGNLIAPYVAQVLLVDYSVWAGLGVMAVTGILVCLMVPVLPFETKDRALYETFTDSEKAEREDRQRQEQPLDLLTRGYDTFLGTVKTDTATDKGK